MHNMLLLSAALSLIASPSLAHAGPVDTIPLPMSAEATNYTLTTSGVAMQATPEEEPRIRKDRKVSKTALIFAGMTVAVLAILVATTWGTSPGSDDDDNPWF